MRLGRAVGRLHRRGQVAGLEVDGELAQPLAELVSSALVRRAGVPQPPAVLEHAAEHEQQRGPLPRLIGESDRRLEVRDRVRQAGGRLRSSELGEHGRACRVRGRLPQRAFQIAHR